MEWIQRNPKKAAGLTALAVLVVIVLVWGMSGGSGTPSGGSTPGAPLATPTATPTHELSVLPTPSSPATGASDVLQALTANGSFDSKSFGKPSGSSQSLTRHHVTVTAQSDAPLMAVGWWIPFADGARTGSDTSGSRSFHHSDGTYGDADLARILAYGGPYSKKTWCTITVDGKVTERQEAAGPYAKVFCQG
ncbi:hypothetical protein ACVW00_004342 [Marmoricola sp. URHA0025 HA25]